MPRVRKPASATNILTQAIVRHLTLYGYNVWRQNNGGVYDPKTGKFRRNPLHKKGVPDIIGFHRRTGKFICVEVKTGKDSLSPFQVEFLSEAQRAGCISIVAHNYDDFVTKLDGKNENRREG